MRFHCVLRWLDTEIYKVLFGFQKINCIMMYNEKRNDALERRLKNIYNDRVGSAVYDGRKSRRRLSSHQGCSIVYIYIFVCKYGMIKGRSILYTYIESSKSS